MDYLPQFCPINFMNMKTTMIQTQQVVNKDSFDLIKGDFTPKEALETLTHLLHKKINFHELRSFSQLIQFGTQDGASSLRIEQLKQSQELVQELVSAARAQGKTLRIKGNISIELI
jgi:hypothetical protein